jgi:hypothetical protein
MEEPVVVDSYSARSELLETAVVRQTHAQPPVEEHSLYLVPEMN